MNTKQEIIDIANDHLTTAEQLLVDGKYLRAIYVAGYTVELYLKAKIVALLDVPDLYIGKYDSQMLKVYKTHDFNQLIFLAGLRNQLVNKRRDINFNLYWDNVAQWSEQLRYQKEDPNIYDQTKATEFIKSVKEIIQWINP